MPKKRHHTQFSKPQSTAPASLVSSGSGTAGHDGPSSSRANNLSSANADHSPGVNELLADLRRRGGASNHSVDVEQMVAPSVPPMIRDILQLPVMPAPRPRQLQRAQPGRRLPAGPAPPRSWLSMSRHAPRHGAQERAVAAEGFERRSLPEAYVPEPGSLIDTALRKFALTWDFQREYWHQYVHDLPTHIRAALVAYLGIWGPSGVTVADLKIILQAPIEDDNDHPGDEPVAPNDGIVNEGFRQLDLTGCIGRSLKLAELSSLLFPSSRDPHSDLQESWDAPETDTSIPMPLLPNLTHLALAIDPQNRPSVSWRQLLSFASHLHTLTHLSLAYWPEPTLTPNAKYTSVVTPQGRSVPYGGTGPYSHTLDGDWAEAVMVLRRLSKALYSLEYLDLTGCADWCQALFSEADHDTIDWVGDWGKIEHLLLYPGYPMPDESDIMGRKRHRVASQNAARVEKHIRAKRAGRGRFITVGKEPILEISVEDLLQELSL
ncbi:hypothetical protein GQ53DRAFT_751658, partial [Thozetella sp. PMI_491]